MLGLIKTTGIVLKKAPVLCHSGSEILELVVFLRIPDALGCNSKSLSASRGHRVELQGS